MRSAQRGDALFQLFCIVFCVGMFARGETDQTADYGEDILDAMA